MQPPKDAKATDGLKVPHLSERSPLSDRLLPNLQPLPNQRPIQRPRNQPLDETRHSGTRHSETKHSEIKHRSTVHSWLQTGALTSAAAGVVLPLAADNAIAYQPASAEPISSAQATPTNRDSVTDAVSQSKAVLAQTSQPAQASFSVAQAAPVDKQTGETSLIKQAEDGSWTLAVPSGSSSGTPAGVSSGPAETQSTLRELRELSQKTPRAQTACTGGDCKGLAYIDKQLPKAQQQVKEAQAKLQSFEAAHAQQNMTSYQKVLASRLSEIIQQQSKLTVSIEQTQQRVGNLKQQLADMDAEVGLAQRALNQSPEYQTKWEQLQQTEQNLIEEFSRANIDATVLNEIYGDYEYQQAALQRVAPEVLGSYLMDPNTVIPSFIQRVPDSLNVVQSLVTATHDQQVQLLRQETIGKIEQKLKTRQSELAGNVGEYEQLQREEEQALQLVAQYETEREAIASKQSSQPQNASSDLALARARKLAPQLPEGSNAQAIIYTILAAGAIATLSAYRKSKQRSFVPTLSLQPNRFQNANLQKTGFQNGDLKKAQFKNAGLASRFAPGLQLAADGPAMIHPTQYLSINKLLDLNTTASTLSFATADQAPVSTLGINPMDVIAAVSHTGSDPSQTEFDASLPESMPLESTPFESTLFESQPLESTSSESTPFESTSSDRALSLEEILSGAGEKERLSAQESSDIFEQRILAELQEITGQPVQLMGEASTSTDEALENNLSIELMSRELNEMLAQTTAEAQLNQEVEARAIAPVVVPLNNIEQLANQAVDWIVKDLGLSPMAAELDRAEREQAEAERQAIADINEAVAAGKAIDIESLEIIRPTRAAAPVEAMASV